MRPSWRPGRTAQEALPRPDRKDAARSARVLVVTDRDLALLVEETTGGLLRWRHGADGPLRADRHGESLILRRGNSGVNLTAVHTDMTCTVYAGWRMPELVAALDTLWAAALAAED